MSVEVCKEHSHTFCKNIQNSQSSSRMNPAWVSVLGRCLVHHDATLACQMRSECWDSQQLLEPGELVHRRWAEGQQRTDQTINSWWICVNPLQKRLARVNRMQQFTRERLDLIHEGGLADCSLIMMTALFCMRTVIRGQRARQRNCNYELMGLKSMCACQILGDCFVRC